MKKLQIHIGLNLEDHGIAQYLRPNGPYFHRWLPDGQKDAIQLNTGDSNAKLSVWFEQRGFVKGGWIKYDHKRKEVDEEILKQQAVLDAGALIGYLDIQSLTDDEYKAVTENLIDDSEYISFGKRVINIIHPPISQLIRILRVFYGQYWLREFEKWDSRKTSLGSYCYSTLQLSWSINDGASWQKFKPTKLKRTFKRVSEGFN